MRAKIAAALHSKFNMLFYSLPVVLSGRPCLPCAVRNETPHLFSTSHLYATRTQGPTQRERERESEQNQIGNGCSRRAQSNGVFPSSLKTYYGTHTHICTAKH